MPRVGEEAFWNIVKAGFEMRWVSMYGTACTGSAGALSKEFRVFREELWLLDAAVEAK